MASAWLITNRYSARQVPCRASTNFSSGERQAALRNCAKVSGSRSPRHNRTENSHTRRSANIGHDSIELDIHLMERLLHMANVGRPMLNQIGAMAQVGAQNRQFGVRTKGGIQQAKGMQALQPLAILPVGLAAAWDLALLWIDQAHMHPTPFQDLINGQPVDA